MWDMDDCCIIEFDSGRANHMVDITVLSPLTIRAMKYFKSNVVIIFLDKFYKIYKVKGIEQFIRFVITHPHMDHITGLYQISRNVRTFGFIRSNFLQMTSYLQNKQRDSLYKSGGDKLGEFQRIQRVLSLTRELVSYYKEDEILILSPTEDFREKAVSQKQEYYEYCFTYKVWCKQVILLAGCRLPYMGVYFSKL